jgi:hypothetical protein
VIDMTRKEFIQVAGRTTILAAMAAMVGLFWGQKRIALSGGGCPTDLACRGCSKLSGCTLPEAKKEKENEPSHDIINEIPS